MTRSPKPPGRNFETLLADLLLSSETLHSIQSGRSPEEVEKKWIFSPGDFFDKWFRENGQAYYFLFRKNLKVTNIQFAELLSLIQSTAKSKATGNPHELQFLSVSEFYAAVSDIVDSFPRQHKKPRMRYDLIARMYYSLLSRHVAVECFFGSCAVFVPPNLEIDLPSICAHSGYIHSCGLNVYTRKIDKAKKEELFTALSRHLAGRNDKPLYFITYAHEDFTKGERQAKKEYLRDGLDDVKIHIEKFYMDAERLVDVVEEMKTEFAGRLVLPPAGKKPGEAKLRNEECDQTRMLWLLVDHSTSEEIQQRGQDRFYICYEQLYLNESPFQLFDENKPAWLAHTTIPHTLLSAMINLTGAARPRKEALVLSDPFVGSGTTWLETMKLDNIVACCTDKTPFAQMMANDNLEFFCLSAKDLGKHRDDLEIIINHLERPAPSELDSASVGILTEYHRAIKFYDSIHKRRLDYATALEDPKNVETLVKKPFFERLLFYLTLRTIARSSAAIKHGSQEWDFAYASQAAHLIGQIGLLIDVRNGEAKPVDRTNRFTIFQGVYSLSCTVSVDTLSSFRADSGEKPAATTGSCLSVSVFDVLGDTASAASSLKPNSCDAIITDPPYGFNTDDDLQSLAELYFVAIEKMILALKQDGHLVLCLLDRSHTGRRSPYFTHKELITQQVLSLAERAIPKREVIIPAYAVPKQKELFRPPYYWESERALRRSILHFRVRIVGD